MQPDRVASSGDAQLASRSLNRFERCRIAALVELMTRETRELADAAQCNADLNKSLYPWSVIQSARARWLS